ncbi:hypothetical protein CYLTODRAFT_406291 [Cylindrobasidium torrendii FP15055 ss-10]|uniref:Uncharacterized protein n=1 Tax=Cylindrobasidium torrendii FP15055 ss-10 TaxID=1314674 RepID=A0A0D7BTN4_9AGAR|nr:hypothetical protein CYLTODRAFT_406291 [Cylindrobasidium torrendii FP15055 ss-10]
MYPKLVALDTDWTLFWGWLKVNEWGRGPNAYSPKEDNIEKRNYWEIQDRTNHNVACGMYADVPKIIKDILKNGAKLAIVSRNTSKAMCDRALWHWTVQDHHGKDKRLIDLVSFDEVYDADKTTHFRKIKEWTKFEYSDMIHFDDEAINNNVEMMLGVTFQVSRDQKGLTWENYQQGLEIWRGNKRIHSPWQGLQLNRYPKLKLLGYSGMDEGTIRQLEAGGRRTDTKEAARYGYAMYVADDPRVAIYFNNWIKNAFAAGTATTVCAVYARDGELWDRMNKVTLVNIVNGREVIDSTFQIWVPGWATDIMQKRGSLFATAWSEEDRDRQVAQWGVKKPYVLFARHPNMGGNFPIPNPQRFNELVIYPQIQENLIVVRRMSDNELGSAGNVFYPGKIRDWNITIPQRTRDDFAAHRENIG